MKPSRTTWQQRVARVDIDVPFHDIDGLSVVWHGHYYKYFEISRTVYMRSIGFDAPQMRKSGYLWLVIESHCRYISPIRYGMKVVVESSLADVEHRVKFLYTIRDKKTGRRLATGYTVQAAVDAKTGALSLVTPKVLLRHFAGKP
jgi:acyl-CoA thioester hydrolase